MLDIFLFKANLIFGPQMHISYDVIEFDNLIIFDTLQSLRFQEYFNFFAIQLD